MGDVTGSTQPKRIAKVTTGNVVNARQEAKAAAVKDILADASTNKVRKAEGLRAILEGASPDDAKAIRRLLKETAQAAKGPRQGRKQSRRNSLDRLAQRRLPVQEPALPQGL